MLTRRSRCARLEPLEPRRLLSAGDLDLAFGSGGATTFANGNEPQDTIAVQPDDKIVVLTYGPDDNSTAVDRFTASGHADSTFGTNGHVEFALTNNPPEGAFATGNFVTALPNGKLLVDASLFHEEPGPVPEEPNILVSDPYLVQLNSDGTLDSTFGIGGILPNISAGGSVHSLAVQSDGKVVRITNSLGITRLNPDGAADTTFGESGTVTLPDTSPPFRLLCLQTDGKIVVGSGDLTLRRYNVDGSLDTSFGTAGEAHFDVPGTALDEPVSMVDAGGGKLRVAVRHGQGLPSLASIRAAASTPRSALTA